jgi:hypothetical protein
VSATFINFHPILLFVGKAWSITIKIESRKGLDYGKLQCCLQILD